MKLTKEQEEHLKEKLKIVETETIFACIKCNERLTGMIEVRKHLDKNNHYEYKNFESNGIIGFL